MLKVTDGVEQGVTVPELGGSSWAGWYTSRLRVSSEKNTNVVVLTSWTGWTLRAWHTVDTWLASEANAS